MMNGQDIAAENTHGGVESPALPAAGFDLAALRLPQDFEADMGVKKALVTVPVRKPSPQIFFRVRAEEEFRLPVALIELKEERETYLMMPRLYPALAAEAVPKTLLTAINRQGDVFLWPIRSPDQNGRLDEWSRSAMKAATLGQRRWIRLVSKMSLGAYEVLEAQDDLPEPEWPTATFTELVQVAFQGRIIDSEDHPVIRKLRGRL